MKILINTQSVYAPIRYEATRPFAAQLGKRFIAAARLGESQRKSFVFNELFDHVRKAVEYYPTEGPGPTQSELTNVQTFGEFQANGKIIFDVAKPLASNLLLTDAESIPCSELEFPVPCFYLHFGTNCDLVDDGFGIEGAFVTKNKERLIIDLVRDGFGQENYFTLPMGEMLVSVPIDMTNGSKSILNALNDSITEVIDQRAKSFADVADLELKLLEEHGEVIKVPVAVEFLQDKRDILRKALGLIVNTLFYLMAEPDDVNNGWGSDTPIEAVNALALASKVGTKKTIENTLSKSGYVKVKYVGDKFTESVSAQSVAHALRDGKTLATHIRRGHFRRQAYGQHFALRKTIFVAPCVVNSGDGELLQGRIYDVRPSE